MEKQKLGSVHAVKTPSSSVCFVFVFQGSTAIQRICTHQQRRNSQTAVSDDDIEGLKLKVRTENEGFSWWKKKAVAFLWSRHEVGGWSECFPGTEKKKRFHCGKWIIEECQSLTHKLPKSFYIVTIDVLNITNLVFLPVLQYLHCYESCVKYPLQRFCQRKDYLYCMYDIS